MRCPLYSQYSLRGFLTPAAHRGKQLYQSTGTFDQELFLFCKGQQVLQVGSSTGEKINSGEEKRKKKNNKPYFIIFYKVHKSCPLYFHRLSLSVVESQNKVKEIGFPQVGGWLLFKVSSGQSYSAVEETYGMGCGGRDKDITRLCSSNSKTTSEKVEQFRGKSGIPGPPCAGATRGYGQSLTIPRSDLGAFPAPRRARRLCSGAGRGEGGSGCGRTRSGAGKGTFPCSSCHWNARVGLAPMSLHLCCEDKNNSQSRRGKRPGTAKRTKRVTSSSPGFLLAYHTHFWSATCGGEVDVTYQRA